MQDLIERLEQAEGGSRKLDAEVYAAAWNEPAPPDIEDWFPHYTTSIDAALTLLPADAYWVLRTMDQISATVWTVDGKRGSASHGSQSIALCIAALKARQG